MAEAAAERCFARISARQAEGSGFFARQCGCSRRGNQSLLDGHGFRLRLQRLCRQMAVNEAAADHTIELAAEPEKLRPVACNNEIATGSHNRLWSARACLRLCGEAGFERLKVAKSNRLHAALKIGGCSFFNLCQPQAALRMVQALSGIRMAL